MNRWAKQKGFTIVELLIVIVVIGVLAAITVVAYSGIQQRAKSAVWASTLHTWENILRLQDITNGQWYDTGGGLICLGSGYVAADGFAANQCIRSVPAAYISVSTSTTFDNAVIASMKSNPSGVLPLVKTVDPAASNREGYARGLIYSYNAAGSTPPFIEYYLDKNTGLSNCLSGDSLEYSAYADGAKRCRRALR